jgi:hypothetical protein
MTSSLFVGVLSLFLASPPQAAGTDAEGFIRQWLVLAPISLDSESGADEVDKDYLKGAETTVKPKAGDKVTIGGKELAWQEHKAGNYYIDFLQSFGKEKGEYVIGYAVAYVNADADMKVTLALSTNDQGKAFLNGKQVFKFAETRVLDKDTDRIEVTLNKGQNVLMLKVINEVNNWQGCARFLKDGAPVKNLTIAMTPQ